MNEKEVDVKKLLEIDSFKLDEEMASCPSFFYMFSELALDAEQIYKKADLALDFHELELAGKFKLSFIPQTKSDKLTETEIKRMYCGDEKWRLLNAEKEKCYLNYKKLEKAAKSVEMKHQSCMSINKRQLYKAGKGIDEL